MYSEVPFPSKSLTIGLSSEWTPEGAIPGVKRRADVASLAGIEALYDRFLGTHARYRCCKHNQLVVEQSHEARLDVLLNNAHSEGFLLLVIPLNSLSEQEQRQVLSSFDIRYVVCDGELVRREDLVIRRARSTGAVLFSTSLAPGETARREIAGLLRRTAGYQHELMSCTRSRTGLRSLGTLQEGAFCPQCTDPLTRESIESVLLNGDEVLSLDTISIEQLAAYMLLKEPGSTLEKRLCLLIDCGFGSYPLHHPANQLCYQEQTLLIAYRLLTIAVRNRSIHIDNLLAAVGSPLRAKVYSKLEESLGSSNRLTIEDTVSSEEVDGSQGISRVTDIAPGTVVILRSMMGTGELRYRRQLSRRYRKGRDCHILRSDRWLSHLPVRPWTVFGLIPRLQGYVNATPFGKRHAVTLSDFEPRESRFQCQCAGVGCDLCEGTGFNEQFRDLKVGELHLGQLWTSELSTCLGSLDFLPEFSHVHRVLDEFGLGDTKAQDSWYSVTAEERILFLLAQAWCIPKRSSTRILLDIGAELTRAMGQEVVPRVHKQLQAVPDHIAVLLVTNDEQFTNPCYSYVDLD